MALPDDGRMDVADTVTIGNGISAAMSPAFKLTSVFMNLLYAETFPTNSNVLKFRKAGFLNASALAEGAVYTPTDADSDINDTSTSVTSAKVVVASPISIEAMRYGAGAADIIRVGEEQGRAIARKFDIDLLALIDSITATSIATTLMDTDTLLGGQFKVYNGLVPPGPLVAVLDFKGMAELRKLVATSGAAVWTTQYNSPIFGVPQSNNFCGNFLGIDLYQATGFSTNGGDNQQVIYDPRYAFCVGMGGAIESTVFWTGYGVASQIPGFSWAVQSWMHYKQALWNDAAACELRSDT